MLGLRLGWLGLGSPFICISRCIGFSLLLSLSLARSLFFLSALFQRKILASDHFPEKKTLSLPVPLPRGLLCSGVFSSNFMPCRCHRLGAALMTRPCCAHTTFLGLALWCRYSLVPLANEDLTLILLAFFFRYVHLHACVGIDVRILFIARFCRDIFCRHGGHVILDLLGLYRR